MKRRTSRVIVALVLLAALGLGLAACSPLGVANASAALTGLTVVRDLKYGPDARNLLDLYGPGDDRAHPTVLFIHGGSWTAGSKDEYRFVGESLARAGYLTAVMSYRLAPQNRYPTYIQDAAGAIRWLRDHASQYGGDPDRIFVTGHSAGAFNALEVVMNARWLREAGVPIQAIKGVVGIAGPYDYDFRQFTSKNAFPEGSDPADIMPSRHVRDDPPPTLLLVAANDQTVEPYNASRMLVALRAKKAEVSLVTLPNVDHSTIIGALGRNLQFLGGTRKAVLDFLAKH